MQYNGIATPLILYGFVQQTQIMVLTKICPQFGSVELCRRSVCEMCGFVFRSTIASKKCIVRASNESELECEFRRASDRQSKSRKRANESEQETVEHRTSDGLKRELMRVSKRLLEDRAVLQRYDLYPEKLSAKLMFKLGFIIVSLTSPGDLLKQFAGNPNGEIFEYMLLKVCEMIVHYNSHDVIIQVQTQETPV